MESISGQAKSDMALAKEMAEMARKGERDRCNKENGRNEKAYEESVKTGMYTNHHFHQKEY